MSEISQKIRACVRDPSVGGDFGEWGALRPDQRRQIRELCDICDEFEQTADALMQERSEWISVDERVPTTYNKYLVFKRGPHGGFLDIAYYTPNYTGQQVELEGRAVWFQFDSDWGDYELDNVTHWMPLPEPPKMKGGE